MRDSIPSWGDLLKPGVMYRADASRRDTYQLYLPTLDLNSRFSDSEDAELALAPIDLREETRFWTDSHLNFELYHMAQAFRRHRPHREANLEINYHCHYGCRHCFQSLVPTLKASGAYAWQQIELALGRLIEAGANEISVTGGDMFLHPHIWDLIDYVHDRFPHILLRLLVNAGALDLDDPTVIEKLAGLLGRRVLIKSDFFGHNAALHDDFTRVPGSFEKLVSLFRLGDQIGLNLLATGALTRHNFATRFELVNFLYNLTDNRFTIASIIFPSAYRALNDLQSLRISLLQYQELLEERFFRPLTSEYHTWELQCGGDCQFTVASSNGESWGCSFFKRHGESSGQTLTLPQIHADWHSNAIAHAIVPQCTDCSAVVTCRQCPSHLVEDSYDDAYCQYSILASAQVQQRVEQAREGGFQFVHSELAEARASGVNHDQRR